MGLLDNELSNSRQDSKRGIDLDLSKEKMEKIKSTYEFNKTMWNKLDIDKDYKISELERYLHFSNELKTKTLLQNLEKSMGHTVSPDLEIDKLLTNVHHTIMSTNFYKNPDLKSNEFKKNLDAVLKNVEKEAEELRDKRDRLITRKKPFIDSFSNEVGKFIFDAINKNEKLYDYVHNYKGDKTSPMYKSADSNLDISFLKEGDNLNILMNQMYPNSSAGIKISLPTNNLPYSSEEVADIIRNEIYNILDQNLIISSENLKEFENRCIKIRTENPDKIIEVKPSYFDFDEKDL